jgi:hypothetical protein
LVGKPGGNNYLEDTGVDGRIILRWIFRKWDGGLDWIDLAQDMNGLRELVKRFNKMRGNT